MNMPARSRRLALLFALLLCLVATPSQAATPPSLTIWSVNEHGTADLMPGQRVEVVIELRSEERLRAFAQHLVPAGLVLEQARASAGDVVMTPFPSWTGEVSATQPINIVLTYRVLDNAQPGDRVIKAQAQVQGGRDYLRASNVVRVCCIPAPPAEYRPWRVYLPVFF